MNSLIIGRRGLGKSTLAEFVAREGNDDVIVFDPNNQFKDAKVRTSSLADLAHYLENSPDDEDMFLAYVPQGEIESEWDAFAAVVWQYGDYALIIDEAHWLQKPNYLNLWLSKFMRQAPRRERNDESPVDIVMTFHRPVDINGLVFGLADDIYIFKVTKSRDLDYLENEFSTEIAEAATRLRTPQSEEPGRDVMRVSVESPEDFEIITDSKSWFVNIRKPAESEVWN